MIELIEMVEKHNTLITIHCGTYFCILGYSINLEDGFYKF